MVNINLTTGGEQREGSLGNKKGIVGVVLVAIILIGAYVGLILWKNSINKSIDNANAEYQAEYAKLVGGSTKSVVDFQNRIVTAKGLLDERNVALETMQQMEKTVVPGVYLDALNFDGKKALSLEAVADNFGVIAKQILSFKKADFFSDASVGRTALDTNGKVKFSVDLKIK